MTARRDVQSTKSISSGESRDDLGSRPVEKKEYIFKTNSKFEKATTNFTEVSNCRGFGFKVGR